ncbi:cadherin domain-containing protein [Kiloniella sp.]|uniref:cadherin domain-containing protein n=1 Tax=Kiloniella sp. TaxID=1938587 RepID=UPI003B02A8C0
MGRFRGNKHGFPFSNICQNEDNVRVFFVGWHRLFIGLRGQNHFRYNESEPDSGRDWIVGYRPGREGDILDITPLLASEANIDNLDQYISLKRSRGGTLLQIDRDGNGSIDKEILLIGTRIKNFDDLKELVENGNLVISDEFTWSAANGRDGNYDGGDGDDTVTVDMSGTAYSGVSITPDDDGNIIIRFTGGPKLTLDGVEDIVIEGTDGDDNIIISGDFSGTDLATSTIVVHGNSGDDTINAASYTSGHNLVAYGGDGDDVITGGAGNDTLYGQGDHDFLNGGDGDDFLQGGDGDDFISGGDGRDTVDFSYLDPSQKLKIDLLTGYAEVYDASGWVETDSLYGIEIAIGSAGDDNMSAHHSGSELHGEDGDDRLYGHQSDDQLYGGKDDDYLRGFAGNDHLYGDDGNDHFRGDSGNDRIYGGSGYDTADYSYLAAGQFIDFSLAAVRVRDENGQTIETDTLIDIEEIIGSDGNDVMQGRYTSVTLYGGNGLDIITGSNRSDYLYGEEGDDTLDGASGNDYLFGGLNDDIIIGGLGNDQLFGGNGQDTVDFRYLTGTDYAVVNLYTNRTDVYDVNHVSKSDSDILSGIENATGGAGDDRLIGTYQNNVLSGAGGNDHLIGGWGYDELYGGSGFDTVDYSWLTDDFKISLQLHDGNGSASLYSSSGGPLIEFDHLYGIENVIGSDGDDYIVGDDNHNIIEGRGGDNYLRGGGGSDTLIGSEGSDVLRGGRGNDTLVGGYDWDSLYGGSGVDTVDYSYLGNGEYVVLDLQDGKSNAFSTSHNSINDYDRLYDIENVIGGAGNDTLIGNDERNILRGADGDDHLEGLGGRDTLWGGDGSNTLIGGYGSDRIIGGIGVDTVDYSYLVNNEHVIVDLGELESHAYGSSNVSDDVDSFFSIENVSGSSGNDTLIGNYFANVLNGAGGNDRIRGGRGSDSLHGGEGDDTLYFDALDDIIDGGAGTDTLIISGEGNDLTLADFVENNTTGMPGLLSGIEKISLTENNPLATGNSIYVGVQDVLNLSDTFNTLTIVGASVDTIYLSLEYSFIGQVVLEGQNFNQYVAGEATVNINIEASQFIDAPPVVTGFEQAIDENIRVTTYLGTVDAIDEIGTIVSYEITSGNNSDFSISDTGELFAIGRLNHEANEQHTLTVTVTDNRGLSADTLVTINVSDVNERPTVRFFGRQADIPEGQESVLVWETWWTDPDEGDTQFFEIVSGNDDGKFTIDPQTGAIWTTGPLDYETKTDGYTLEIQLTDSGGLSSSSFFKVNVIDGADGPTVAGFEKTIDENTSGVSSLGTVIARDDGTIVSYEITDGNNGQFSINNSGEVFVTGGLDKETLDQHILTVTVTDNDGLITDASVIINVGDVNEAPTVSLQNTISNIAEDQDTSSAFKVADIIISDDVLGTNNLSLSGTDTALFEIVGSELYLKAGTSLDYETNPTFDVTIEVDDAAIAGNPDSSVNFSLTITDVNEVPTVSLQNLTTDILEDSDTTNAIKVADIVVTDDALGTNILGLTGADAGSFEIIGNELFLKAGANLDFETNSSMDVTVTVDDIAIAGNPDSSLNYSLSITDVNEAPSVSLQNVTTEMSEATNTGTAIKVADIVIADDALGTNNLSLSGADAGLFLIFGSAIYLKRDSVLDFDTNPSLDVTLEVDDGSIVGSPDDTANLSITVLEENQSPHLAVQGWLNTLAEDTNTSAAIKVATVYINDDDLGTNVLNLSGADAGLFEIIGNDIFLIAGALLDFETNPTLDLRIEVDDASIPGDPDSSVNFPITITDVNEGPSNLTAYDSVYSYHTDSHSIASGMGLINPFDGTDLLPSVLVEGGATNYSASNAVNGTASFTDPAQPVFGFIPTDIAAFEGSNNTGSFSFSADDGGAPVSGTVEIKSYTSLLPTLIGGDGNDVLIGGIGTNYLYGGLGNDILSGSSGTNTLYGNAGDDFIIGGIGTDRIHGQEGDDIIHGGAFYDQIFYNLDKDYGEDRIDGGDDNDTLYMYGVSTTQEFINITAGTDNTTLIQDALSVPADWSTARTQTVSNVETLSFIDQLPGTDGINMTIAGDLASVSQISVSTNGDGVLNVDGSGISSNTKLNIVGDAGDDIAHGGAGGDWFYAQEGGTDVFNGNAGDDLVRFDSNEGISSVTADGGADKDHVQLHLSGNRADVVSVTASAGTDFTMDINGTTSTFDNFENLYVYEYDTDPGQGLNITLSGDFSFAFSGAETPQIHSFGGPLNIDASDVTSLTGIRMGGGIHVDELTGGAGSDIIDGKGGNDTIEGGRGSDNMTGGTGNDTFVFTADVFAQTSLFAIQKDDIMDYTAGDIIDLTDVYDYIENTLFGTVDSVENFVDVGAADGILRVTYTNVDGTTIVDLADLIGYTGDLNIVGATSALSAYDSVYYYHTDSHSLAPGMTLINPLDGTDLFPSVLVDGGATNYVATGAVNGTGSFGDATQPVYSFSPTDLATFEAADSTGSFTYDADDCGTPVSGTVEIKSFTSSTGKTWNGGAGHDVLIGGAGGDNISGGAGDDIIFGGGGFDRLYGEDGDDFIYAGDGNSWQIFGGAGNDTLVGGTGNNGFFYNLYEESGEDIVYGDAGNDSVWLRGNPEVEEFVHISAGLDSTLLVRDSATATNWTVDDLEAARTQTLSSVESIYFEEYYTAENPAGNAGYNITATGNLTGIGYIRVSNNTNGAITFDGSGITSATTNTQVNDSIGNDTYHGGAGKDWFIVQDGGEEIFQGNGGDDTVSNWGGVSKITADGGVGIDRMSHNTLSSELDTVEITGDGIDTYTIDDGNGNISSYTDFEFLTMTDSSTDELNGLNVTIVGDFTGTLDTVNQNTMTFSSGGILNLDASGVTSSSTFIAGNGSSFGDILRGGAGQDYLRGYGGDDTIEGGLGNDHLVGGEGSDTVNGGEGNDLIEAGGQWADILTGGAGADEFDLWYETDFFGSSAGANPVNTITDYSLTENDLLDLGGAFYAIESLTNGTVDSIVNNAGDLTANYHDDSGSYSTVIADLGTYTGIVRYQDDDNNYLDSGVA